MQLSRRVVMCLALLGAGVCLWITALTSCLGIYHLSSTADDDLIIAEMERKVGLPVETYPNGAFKVSLATMELTDTRTGQVRRYEKWLHIDEAGRPVRQVIKTPTREIVKETDLPPEGGWRWKAPQTVRDDRPHYWAYYGLPLVLTFLGSMAFVLMGFQWWKHRQGQPSAST